jgi:LmbE family N-acetylglucosaminyl deacetylase
MRTSVLVIAPHPDDEVMGCGGVIARHVAQGDTVTVLVITRGIPELFPPPLIERTRDELRIAHDLLGITQTHFLNFQAPMLDMQPTYQLADAISKVIRETKAERVYLPHRGDLHHDHQAVTKAALVAARPINKCTVRQLLSYETPSETEWALPSQDSAFTPNVFVDISDYLKSKLDAMACIKSQLRTPPHPRSLQHIEALARLRGNTVGFAAAEAFMLVREIEA